MDAFKTLMFTTMWESPQGERPSKPAASRACLRPLRRRRCRFFGGISMGSGAGISSLVIEEASESLGSFDDDVAAQRGRAADDVHDARAAHLVARAVRPGRRAAVDVDAVVDERIPQIRARFHHNFAPLAAVVDGRVLCVHGCLLYTSPSPRDVEESRMPSSA